MERYNFIRKLEELLAKVPEDDRKEMLYDYEEHFSVGIANGKTEAEIVLELGDPHVIARDLLLDYRQTKMLNAELDETEEKLMEDLSQSYKNSVNIAQKQSSSSTVNSVLASIGLGFFNLVFVLGPVLGIFGVFIGLWAAVLVLILSPLVTIGAFIFNGLEVAILVFFMSLITLSLGIFLGIGLKYATSAFYKGLKNYGKFNMRVIKGNKGEFVA